MLLFPEADGVITRFLENRERPFPTGEARLPLVIEPAGERSRNLSFLKAFLSKRSVAVKSALYEYGAVLLRGFQVASEPDFEESLSSIHGVQAMSCYFMSEAGREVIKGTRSVWSTNTEHKTGGTFDFHAFHSENFYTTDVPAIQSFWCKKAPWFGGETAFTHMAHAYSELDAALQSRLESEPVWAVRWSIERLATRYRIPEDAVEAFCLEIGLKVLSFNGTKYVIITKPSVFVHPLTRNRSLQVNLSAELPGLQAALRRRFLPHYQGLKWAPHRYGWKHDRVATLLTAINRATTKASPRKLLTRLTSRVWSKSAQRGAASSAVKRQKTDDRNSAGAPHLMTRQDVGMPRIRELLKPGDVESIAAAVGNHTSVFTWKQGDVVIFDNTQLLHAGMPGLGSRELAVILANPLRMHRPLTSGVLEVSLEDGHVSMEQQLKSFLERQQVTHE